MTPLLILMKALALSALLTVLVSAHYLEIDNRCKPITITGSISDIRWRGRTKSLGPGRTDTDGDTQAQLQTTFGTISVNMLAEGSTLTTKLDPRAAGIPKEIFFNGTVGFDVPGNHWNETTFCSIKDDVGCKVKIGVLNGQQWPAYANLLFTCNSGGPPQREVTAH